MTTTNHFRGRRLGTNLKSPVSPRHHHPKPSSPPPPVTSVHYSATWDWDDGVNHTTSPGTVAGDATRIGTAEWDFDGIDAQGNTFSIGLGWDGTAVTGITLFLTWPDTSTQVVMIAFGAVNPTTFPDTQGPLSWSDNDAAITFSGDVTVTFPLPWSPP